MAFDLHIADTEQAYLDALPLSVEAKERVDQFIQQFIVNVSDDFRLDEANRPNPAGPYFRVHYLLWDRWGDGRMHTLEFQVRDDKAAFGVLLLVFIDRY